MSTERGSSHYLERVRSPLAFPLATCHTGGDTCVLTGGPLCCQSRIATERLATLIAIAAGWLLILAYLVMLLANFVAALQEGTSGNLLARVFSFAGLGVDQPWLEAYALANVLILALFFSLATRALLRDALAAKPDPLAMTSPAPAPPTESAAEHLSPSVSLAEPPPVDRLIGHDSELEQDPQRALGLSQDDESIQVTLDNTFASRP